MIQLAGARPEENRSAWSDAIGFSTKFSSHEPSCIGPPPRQSVALSHDPFDGTIQSIPGSVQFSIWNTRIGCAQSNAVKAMDAKRLWEENMVSSVTRFAAGLLAVTSAAILVAD